MSQPKKKSRSAGYRNLHKISRFLVDWTWLHCGMQPDPCTVGLIHPMINRSSTWLYQSCWWRNVGWGVTHIKTNYCPICPTRTGQVFCRTHQGYPKLVLQELVLPGSTWIRWWFTSRTFAEPYDLFGMSINMVCCGLQLMGFVSIEEERELVQDLIILPKNHFAFSLTQSLVSAASQRHLISDHCSPLYSRTWRISTASSWGGGGEAFFFFIFQTTTATRKMTTTAKTTSPRISPMCSWPAEQNQRLVLW